MQLSANSKLHEAMARPVEYIQHNRAGLFDWLSFILSLSLSFIFPSLREFSDPGVYSPFILWALVAYVTGALLKDVPLRYRFRLTGKKVPEFSFLLFLVLGHWIIMLVATGLTEPAVRKLLAMHPVKSSNFSDSPAYGIFFILSFLLTWIVYRNKKPLSKNRGYSPLRLARQEWVADLLLLVGVGCLSFVFWEKGIMGLMSQRGIKNISDIWYLFGFLCFEYLLFFLPLRYLFMVEDYRSGRAWRRLLIIFGLLLLRAFFEMLRL